MTWPVRLIIVSMLLIGLGTTVVVIRRLDRSPDSDLPVNSDTAGALAPVRVVAPPVAARGVVVLLSDRQGWDAAMDEAAQAIAEAGEMVVGFDTPQVFAHAVPSDAGCLDLAAMLGAAVDRASGRDAEEQPKESHRSPVLAGMGDGATLAYALLAQSPEGRFAGAVPVSFTGALASRAPLCPGASSEPAGDGVFRYRPAAMLSGWLALVSDHPDAPAIAAYAAAADAEVIRVHGNFDFPASVITVLAQVREAERRPDSDEGTGGVAELPLVPLPVDQSPGLMAVIYSGDGGWRDADKRLGEALQAHGVPVLGVDSLRYFWREKTPEQTAADLAAVLGHYREIWDAPEVLLIGYSFGADILPFAVNRLAPEVREHVVQVSLLGLADRADFAIQVAGWLGAGPSDNALPVLPEIERLDRAKLQCFYGEEEDDTACTRPALAEAETVAMPGGHHFDGEYDEIARRIVDSAHRRLSAAEEANSASSPR